MSVRSLTRGHPVFTILSLITDLGETISEIFSVPVERDNDAESPRRLQFTYEPGGTPPGGAVIELRGALEYNPATLALVDPVVLDTYSTPATRTTRSVDVQNYPFFDVRLSGVTGTPTGISSKIYY